MRGLGQPSRLTSTTGVVIKFTPFVIVLFIAHIFVQVYRALNEEAVLSATFTDYEDYRQRTPWRFVPGLC